MANVTQDVPEQVDSATAGAPRHGAVQVRGQETAHVILKPGTASKPATTELNFFNPKNSPFMPVEFSGAAYRYGHSQVRAFYGLNDTVTGVPIFAEPDRGRWSTSAAFAACRRCGRSSGRSSSRPRRARRRSSAARSTRVSPRRCSSCPACPATGPRWRC